MTPEDRSAAWIGAGWEADTTISTPCPFLRKSFTTEGNIVRARVYATALGLYELWLNGQRVGEDYFTPGWTDYRQRVQYQTYDVTGCCATGTTRSAPSSAMAGTAASVWDNRPQHLRADRPQLLAQLEINYADGRAEPSSPTIPGTAPPARCSPRISIMARLMTPAARCGLERGRLRRRRHWRPVPCHACRTAIAVHASASPPVRKIEKISPLGHHPGRARRRIVFDLGQNMVGLGATDGARRHPRRARQITLRFAEVLNPDGTLYTANLRTANAPTSYITHGKAARSLRAALHLPRLPLRRGERPSRRAATRRRSPGSWCIPTRRPTGSV